MIFSCFHVHSPLWSKTKSWLFSELSCPVLPCFIAPSSSPSILFNFSLCLSLKLFPRQRVSVWWGKTGGFLVVRTLTSFLEYADHPTIYHVTPHQSTNMAMWSTVYFLLSIMVLYFTVSGALSLFPFSGLALVSILSINVVYLLQECHSSWLVLILWIKLRPYHLVCNFWSCRYGSLTKIPQSSVIFIFALNLASCNLLQADILTDHTVRDFWIFQCSGTAYPPHSSAYNPF